MKVTGLLFEDLRKFVITTRRSLIRLKKNFRKNQHILYVKHIFLKMVKIFEITTRRTEKLERPNKCLTA
jgi:hypothetical protein